jgi:hypothetical protein
MTIAAPSPAKTLSEMGAQARAWVYKAPRNLGQAEQKMIREKGLEFTSTWAAHGAPLDAAVEVLFDRFVVIAVDEEQARASGCSIDKSVGFIKQLEYDLNLMLTDRMIVVFEQEGRIMSCRLQELPDLIKDGTITDSTIVYDDLVPTIGEMRERFRVPLKSTWLQRYL